MPRRRGAQAQEEIDRARLARWRLLLRNPTFRDDVRALVSLGRDPKYPAPAPGMWDAYWALKKTWNVEPPDLKRFYGAPELTLETVPVFERLLEGEERS